MQLVPKHFFFVYRTATYKAWFGLASTLNSVYMFMVNDSALWLVKKQLHNA